MDDASNLAAISLLQEGADARQPSFDAGLFSVTTEWIPISDERLGGTWDDGLTRVLFRAASPPAQGRRAWRFDA
ncbi:MAG: hypothetical protein KJZ93_28825 [Caldilineaceae bacterium]|nr:hypothetical protein [Caldilineaceae bacterium]